MASLKFLLCFRLAHPRLGMKVQSLGQPSSLTWDEGTVARPTSPTVSLFAGRDYDQEENNDNHSVIWQSLVIVVLIWGPKGKAGLDSDQADNDWKKLLETVSKDLGCPVITNSGTEENKSYLIGGSKPEKKSMVELPLEGVCAKTPLIN